MEYKNNYQRKQAVWREKWMRKVEERHRKMELYRPIIEAGLSLRKAFEDIAEALSEYVTTISEGLSEAVEILSTPEAIEELKRLQKEESQNI